MKTLFVIDAYNLIYRMFYAIPEINTREGKPVNAIFGVAKFLKALADENPEAAMVVATDVGESFRAKEYSEYKAQRDRMPDNLRSQIDGVFSLFSTLGITVLAREGYEADDIIGSLVHDHESDEYQVVIISSDKDLCQFVRDGKVHIYDAMKRKFMREVDVKEKFWVPVHQVRDYLAIVGDASDNIPGISGFGPKKAVDLLEKYNTLEGIYENISDLTEKMQATLHEQRENAFLSKKLATIVTDLEIEDFAFSPFRETLERGEYVDLLKSYEFKSLIPASAREEKKLDISRTKKEITTIWELTWVIENIEKSRRCSITVTPESIIGIWVWDYIFTLDARRVDVTSFIDFILAANDIEVLWYDLKEDIKKLLRIKNPLGESLEGQGRLF